MNEHGDGLPQPPSQGNCRLAEGVRVTKGHGDQQHKSLENRSGIGAYSRDAVRRNRDSDSKASQGGCDRLRKTARVIQVGQGRRTIRAESKKRDG